MRKGMIAILLIWTLLVASSVSLFDRSRHARVFAQDFTAQTNRANAWTQPQYFKLVDQVGPAANTTTTPANGYSGSVTLAANTATVTFPTAYSLAPSCVCTDQTTPQLVKCPATTASVVITDTVGATDVVSWVCFGNPN